MEKDFKNFRIPFEKAPPMFWESLNFIPDEKKSELIEMSKELRLLDLKKEFRDELPLSRTIKQPATLD